jgi:hypothetical protein
MIFSTFGGSAARGIGEIGITGVAAAIANAIYHATGKGITSLPITLDKLVDMVTYACRTGVASKCGMNPGQMSAISI